MDGPKLGPDRRLGQRAPGGAATAVAGSAPPGATPPTPPARSAYEHFDPVRPPDDTLVLSVYVPVRSVPLKIMSQPMWWPSDDETLPLRESPEIVPVIEATMLTCGSAATPVTVLSVASVVTFQGPV